jgi:hypothetical protein
MDNVTPEEQKVRLKKADSIRRMLLAEQSSAGSGGNRNPGNIYFLYGYIMHGNWCTAKI